MQVNLCYNNEGYSVEPESLKPDKDRCAYNSMVCLYDRYKMWFVRHVKKDEKSNYDWSNGYLYNYILGDYGGKRQDVNE